MRFGMVQCSTIVLILTSFPRSKYQLGLVKIDILSFIMICHNPIQVRRRMGSQVGDV